MRYPPCVVLAGGLGTRLSALVSDRPKCLAPIGARTFLECMLGALSAQGITDFVLALGHGADQVVQAIMSFKISGSIRYVVEPRALGTGGAAIFAMNSLGISEALVANGDTYLDGDLAGMSGSLDLAGGEYARMATVEVDDRSRFGGVSVGRDGRIQSFLERGQQGPGTINAGLYRIHRLAFPALTSSEALSLESEVLVDLALKGVLFAVPVGGAFTDIGVPDDYRRFCNEYG